jgi:hypothetical protein
MMMLTATGSSLSSSKKLMLIPVLSPKEVKEIERIR